MALTSQETIRKRAKVRSESILHHTNLDSWRAIGMPWLFAGWHSRLRHWLDAFSVQTL